MIAVRYSGGSGNANGAAALGGAIGGALTMANNALFGTPSRSQILSGLTDYRCIYLHNIDTATATDLRAWISTPTSDTDVSEAIGEDISNPAQVISSATSVPPSVSFSQPSNYATGLTLGNISADGVIPIWIRRSISPDAAEGAKTFTLAFQWTEAGSPSTHSVIYTVIAPGPPEVLNKIPAPDSVASPTTNVTAKLLPLPGRTIDPTTVNAATAYVHDSATGTLLPSVITLGATDVDGAQLLTIDLKSMLSPLRDGNLWPRVFYTVVLNGIEDSTGLAIIPTSWEFQADGPVGAAISPQEIVVGWNVGTI